MCLPFGDLRRCRRSSRASGRRLASAHVNRIGRPRACFAIGCSQIRRWSARSSSSAAPAPVLSEDRNTPGPAVASGRDDRGAALVVVCSVGIDLDLVPFAADARLAITPARAWSWPLRSVTCTRSLSGWPVAWSILRRSSRSPPSLTLCSKDSLPSRTSSPQSKPSWPTLRCSPILSSCARRETAQGPRRDRVALPRVPKPARRPRRGTRDARRRHRRRPRSDAGRGSDAEATLVGSRRSSRDLLLPRDPNDGKNVIVEIRGAEGGEEANLFARDLLRDVPRLRRAQGLGIEVIARRRRPTSAGTTRSRSCSRATACGAA